MSQKFEDSLAAIVVDLYMVHVTDRQTQVDKQTDRQTQVDKQTDRHR